MDKERKKHWLEEVSMEPSGSYFGLVVTNPYDPGQCYSYGWETLRYYGDHCSETESAFKSYPDIDWSDREEYFAAYEQLLAEREGWSDKPAKVFFIEKRVVARE